MAEIERFVVLLYKKTSQLCKVNEARNIFFSAGRKIQNVPPTKAALVQHVERAVYQAGHIWGQVLVASPVLPSPSDWGWVQVGEKWHPYWISLEEASKACQELIR